MSWEEPRRDWLGGYLHPGWQNGWRRLVAALRWLGARISWPMAAFFPVGVVAPIVVRAVAHAGVPEVLPVVLSLIGAIGGMAGVLFGALRYNRDEALKVVQQQRAVLDDVQRFNRELLERVERCD